MTGPSRRGRRPSRAVSLLLVATSLGGIAAALRSMLTPGSRSHSATHVVDAVALIVAVIAAGLEAKSSAFQFEVQPQRARRRAVALALAGTVTTPVSCVAAVWVSGEGSPALVEAVVYAALICGFGAGLAGLASLAWWYGGAYAARRIEAMGKEDP